MKSDSIQFDNSVLIGGILGIVAVTVLDMYGFLPPKQSAVAEVTYGMGGAMIGVIVVKLVMYLRARWRKQEDTQTSQRSTAPTRPARRTRRGRVN